jgi:DUF971 family protein
LLIKRIWQLDNHSFCIEWSDGETKTYLLSDLQKNCPCAGCAEQPQSSTKTQKDVRAKRIVSVGRYALRIFFLTGCSNGIYDFAFLKGMQEI